MGVGAGIAVVRDGAAAMVRADGAFAGGVRPWHRDRRVSPRGERRRHLVHETPVRALANLVGKNNRRYGGYIIHLGVVFAFVGIVASSFFRTEVKRSVRTRTEL